MTTFVLVHGAWHGGWCWDRVRRVLEQTGDSVYTPTLIGSGERAHLASRDTGLETHVQDTVDFLKTADLRGVVLVAHSYAGLVATSVADRAGDRIARLVYLDAVVPRDGECMYDRAPAQIKAHFEEQTRVGGDGWLVPASAVSASFLGLTRAEDIRWVMPKLTPHPVRTFREAVRLASRVPPVPRTYINCIGDKPLGQPRTIQAEGIDDYHELPTGHDAMVTLPRELASLLQKVVKPSM